MRQRENPQRTALDTIIEAKWKASKRKATTPDETGASFLECGLKPLKDLAGRNGSHRPGVQFQIPALRLLPPRSIHVSIRRSVQFLPKRPQQRFFLGGAESPYFSFEFRQRTCHSTNLHLP